MKLQQALQIAQAIWNNLYPHCELIDIAGSVRREKPDVKDIEIVCLPRKEGDTDLFGNITDPVATMGFLLAVRDTGDIVKGNPERGKYCQIALPQGINLDLFMPARHDYYRQLVIRTGSADYVRMVIAKGWNKLGWVGTPDGLRLRTECENISIGGGKYKWKVLTKNPKLPPEWISEKAFYDWLGVPYIEPKERS